MPSPKRRRKPPVTPALLAQTLRGTAAWLAQNGTRKLGNAEGRRQIDTALETLEYVTEAMVRVRRLADGQGHHPLGFDASGDLVVPESRWDAPDHGQDLEYEHGAERPAGRRRIGFR